MVRHFALVALIGLAFVAVSCGTSSHPHSFNPYPIKVLSSIEAPAVVEISGLVMRRPGGGVWQIWDEKSRNVYNLLGRLPTSDCNCTFKATIKVRVALHGTDAIPSDLPLAEILEVMNLYVYQQRK